jgi:hypothetical protein
MGKPSTVPSFVVKRQNLGKPAKLEMDGGENTKSSVVYK